MGCVCMLLCYALAEGQFEDHFFSPLFNIANLFTQPLVIFACEVLTKTERSKEGEVFFLTPSISLNGIFFFFYGEDMERDDDLSVNVR